MPASLQQLVEKRSRLRPGKPFPPVGSFSIIKTAEDPRGNYWAVAARFVPLTDKDRDQYLTMIVFHDIDFSAEYDKSTPIKVELFPGRFVYMEIPSFSKTPVKVTCTCADFFWTWWYYNSKRKALAITKFPHPSTVTGRNTRVSDDKPYGSPGPRKRNKKNVEGVCKHIYALALKLGQQRKLVK